MSSSARWIACFFAGLVLAPLAGCGGEAVRQDAEYPEPIGYTPPEQAVAAAEAPAPPAARRVAAEGDGEMGVGPEIAIGAENQSDEYSDTDPAALSDFRSELQPYGEWRDDPTYGTVWSPSAEAVGSDFKPYVSAGHWVYEDEQVWVSDYSWGWIPFHYGRWVYVAGWGWSWVPGRVYRGAWVSWRYGYDDWAYVGWAPMPPMWGWFGGVAVGFAVVPPAPYVFCGSRYFYRHGVGGYIVTGSQVPVVAARTRPFVPAAPVVAGHAGSTGARPVVATPSPQQLHVPAADIARPTSVDQGRIARAQQVARPSAATSFGARPPMARPGVTPGFASPAVPSGGARAPYAPPPNVRGSLGVPPAQNTPYHPPANAYPQPQYHTPSAPVSPSFQAPRPQYVPPSQAFPRGPTYNPPSAPAPRYSPPPSRAPTYQPSPGFRPSAPSAPSFHAPSMGAAPSFQAPRPSAPMVRPSAPVRPSSPARPSGGRGGGRR